MNSSQGVTRPAYRFATPVARERMQVEGSATSSWRRDLICLVLLLAVGVATKLWLLAHTEAMARDGIIYVTFAARLGQEPFFDVLRQTDQHPLYPVFILGMEQLVEAWQGRSDCLTWQLSAQLTNIAASWLLIIPLYFLGKELGTWKIGFWTAMLYQCLPVAARFTADGVAEGTYLLFSALGLYSAARGFRTRSPWAFALCGISAGLAYLARPEGAMLVTVVLFVLVLTWWRGGWSAGARRVLVCSLALAMGLALTAAPYWAILGRFSNKPSTHQIFETSQTNVRSTAPALLIATTLPSAGDAKDYRENAPFFALWQVLDEISKSLLYGIWGMTALSMLAFHRKLFTRPGLAVVFFLPVVHLLVLWRLACVRHYVSERHTMLIDLCAVCLAVYLWVHWETLWRQHLALVALEGRKSFLQRLPHPRYLLAAGVMALCIWGVARTLRPLHANRVPLREAGFWLAKHASPNDQIIDPYGWPRFYANYYPELVAPERRLQPGRYRYLVVDFTDDDKARHELIRRVFAEHTGQELVFAWPSAEMQNVAIYRTALEP